MSESQKWIACGSPDQPAAEVGRMVLTSRLAMVHGLLPQAMHGYEQSIEHVHQLRVSCRRGQAAMLAFAEFVPAKRGRRLQKLLKSIRRSANDARDCDVLLARLQREAHNRPEMQPVVETIAARREPAQQPLLAEGTAVLPMWPELVPKLLAKIRWRGEGFAPTFQQLAFAQVRNEFARFLALARQSLKQAEILHEVRIAAKRVRYTMEIFVSAFDTDFRQRLYPQLSAVQEKLGVINDHATAQQTFQALLGPMPPTAGAAQLARLVVHEHEAFEHCREEFVSWWNVDTVDALAEGFQTALDEPIRTAG